jgi:hypothetical protein
MDTANNLDILNILSYKLKQSCPEGKFLVRDHTHSKLITLRLIRRESFSRIFWFEIRNELVVKLCLKLMTNSLQLIPKVTIIPN